MEPRHTVAWGLLGVGTERKDDLCQWGGALKVQLY